MLGRKRFSDKKAGIGRHGERSDLCCSNLTGERIGLLRSDFRPSEGWGGPTERTDI